MNYPDILSFIEKETGITLKPVNMKSLNSFLDDRIRDFSGSSQVYLHILKTVKEEYERLLDHVTINETYFFREEKQFKFLKNVFIPEHSGNAGTLNFWSASCSSGEEPLSLYAMLKKELPMSFKIYASDINAHILQKFRDGCYRKASLRTDGKVFHELLCGILADDDETNRIIVRNEVIREIDIRELNLFNDEFSSLPQMDCIFLRNTLIYMNTGNKQRVINKIAGKLNSGGILFLSASEIAHISHPQLEVVSSYYCYYLRKKDPGQMGRQSFPVDYDAGQRTIQQDSGARPQAAERIPDVKESERIPEEREVCLIISSMLNNPIFETEDTQASRSAGMFVKIMFEIKSNNLQRAGDLFNSLDPGQHPSSLYNFFGGFIPLQSGDRQKASDYFQKALEVNARFWPARYYIIFNCNPVTHREEMYLRILINDINSYISDNRIDYQFLLEGFNAKYFREICTARLEKLN